MYFIWHLKLPPKKDYDSEEERKPLWMRVELWFACTVLMYLLYFCVIR